MADVNLTVTNAEILMRESEIVSVAKALMVLVEDAKDLVQADSNKQAVTYFAKKMGMSKPNLLMCFEVKKTDRPKTYALKERTKDRRTSPK